MKALHVLSLVFLTSNVWAQGTGGNGSFVPTPARPTTNGSFNNNGAYSAEQICSQGPGLMQGQPVYNQGGIFSFSGGQQNNPCAVTCQNQEAAWMVAKPHGAPCRIPSDPEGERYCLNQVCVAYNASLNDYCRGALNLDANSPSYIALMPYGCTVSCLDKSTPSVVQVQFANGMACQVHTPNRRISHGYCMNGACSTLTYREQGGFFDYILDPRRGSSQGQGNGQSGYYPVQQSYFNPFQSLFGGLFGGRRR